MDSKKKLTPEEKEQLIEALNRYENDITVHNLRNMLVATQFNSLQEQPFETLELKDGHLQTVLCSDYNGRSKSISSMLFDYTLRKYPELFGKFGDPETV